MPTLNLYHGDVQLPITFKAPTSGTETDRVVRQAREELSTKFSALSEPQLLNFEQNLRRWIAAGGDGAFLSINRAVDGAAPTPRAPKLSVFCAANEIEMRGHQIKDAAGKIGYSNTVADTGTKVGKWDLFALTADQVNEDHTEGCIEVVFAKENVTDKAELSRRATVMRLLKEALDESTGKPLHEAVSAFNDKLGKASDSGLLKYKLNNIKHDVDIEVKPSTYLATQTNVEIDLRKLGDMADTTVLDLFCGPHHADDKAMFIEARKQANKLVDEVFTDTASALHSGRFKKDSIKLDKLRATMTLLLYSTAKVKTMGSKGSWPVLPKVGAGDLIRETFNTRDKLTLFAHTSDDTRYAALETKMMAALAGVKGARSYDRGIGERENIPFGKKKVSEAWLMRDELREMLRPGEKTGRWGEEKSCYGRVNWSDDSYSGTITGKPIRTTYNEAERSLRTRLPKVVLEVRRQDNYINAMFSGLTSSERPSVEGHSAYARLKAAASPWTGARGPKSLI